VIERQLRQAGVEAEVLRFGMDGAPLSQYLNVLRREVRAFKPDVVLVQLIHNDFDESYRFLKTRYASSFLKIGLDQDGQPVEIEPADFKPGMADRLRAFNTFRYLYYKTNAYLRLRASSAATGGVGRRSMRHSSFPPPSIAAKSPTMSTIAASPFTSCRRCGLWPSKTATSWYWRWMPCAMRFTRASR
jgi:hypothetical protein